MKRMALLGLLLLLASPAAGQGPAPVLIGEGQRLAHQWCANCHAVAPGQRPPAGDAAASFPAIAALPSTTEASLRVFLQTPHAGMPDYRLSRTEMDALVSYILSLRR